MAKKRVDGEIKVTNGFAALNAKKKGKKNAKDKAAGASEDKANVFAFVSQNSSSAWGDDSDDEMAPAAGVVDAVPAEEEEDDEEEEDSEEESDEEEEEEEESPTPAKPVNTEPKAEAAPVRTLSKKEKKQLEMEALDSALAELGIKTETPAPKVEETKPEPTPATTGESASSSASKKKKKGKKKSSAAATPSTEETEAPAVVDIKDVLKAKGKKKKTSSAPNAVKIAREAVQDAKAKKKNRDKAAFNEFSY